MSGFGDIARAYGQYKQDGSWENVRRGLIYTCNAGWIDLGHADPRNSDSLIGARNLWSNVRADGPAYSTESYCVQPGPAPFGGPVQPAGCSPFTGAGSLLPTGPTVFRFPNGQAGYLVRFRQQHGRSYAHLGYEGRYLVSFGLTEEQKKSVALSIFMNVSEAFEWTQRILGLGGMLTNSGHSQEDLVSDLIGFYIGIGELTHSEAITLCHPVSHEAAEQIWNTGGAVGDQKNTSWSPAYEATGYNDHSAKMCRDACAGQPGTFPAEFRRITPAKHGQTFIKLGRGNMFRWPH